jgi:hypothetical protein
LPLTIGNDRLCVVIPAMHIRSPFNNGNSTVRSLVHILVTWSGPLYTYVYRYLTTDMDEYISTLMCAWYLVVR